MNLKNLKGYLKTIFGQTPEKYEQRGDTFLNIADWGRAKLEYEKALDSLERASPVDEESATRLQEKLRRSTEALAAEHTQTGEDFMEQGYYDEAREWFQLATTLSQDPALISEIESHLLEMERLTGEDIQRNMPEPGLSPQVHDETVSHEPEDEMFMALCGALPVEVRAAYSSYGASFKSGFLALNRGEFDLAADELSRAMEENPAPDSFIPLELATAFLNLGELDEAQGLLEIFLQYHPDALPGYQVLCEVFWEMRAFDRSEALLTDCPEELKNSLAHYLLRGETLFRAGNYSEARSFYQDFIKEHGWNEPVARGLAGTFEALGDYENARDMYAEIMTQCSSCHTRIDPGVKRKFADISFDLGQNASTVLETYLSLAQEDPENSPFYYKRVSQIYASLGNEEEAHRFQLFAQQAQNGKG